LVAGCIFPITDAGTTLGANIPEIAVALEDFIKVLLFMSFIFLGQFQLSFGITEYFA
jgi:hypothetical protein